MRIVPVICQKGGVAKTTTVMGLAGVAAEAGMRTAVVDVDPQGSAIFWASRADEGELPFDVAKTTDPNDLSQLRNLDYDVVFVDTPGSIEQQDILVATLQNADFVILPIEPAPLALQPLLRTVETLIRPSNVPHRVLLSKVDPRVLADADGMREVMESYELDVFKAIIREYKIHQNAPGSGIVVTQYPGDRISQRAAGDFRAAATELFAVWARA